MTWIIIARWLTAWLLNILQLALPTGLLGWLLG